MSVAPLRGGLTRSDALRTDYGRYLAQRKARAAMMARKNPKLALLEAEQLAAQSGLGASDGDRKFFTTPQCQLSVGTDDQGRPKGPWHPADADQFAAAQRNRPKGDPYYNMVLDPRDNKHKIYRTTSGMYCVRDRPMGGKLPDLLKTVQRIEKIAKALKIGRQDKQKEMQKSWREKSNERLAAFDRLMRVKQHGNQVDFEPTNADLCGMGGENGDEWNREFGTPNNPTQGGLNASTYEKMGTKQWYRPWYIQEPDQDPYCAADDSDLPLRYPDTYHSLSELRNVSDDDKPRGTRGYVTPDGKLYQDAMFCAQQQRKNLCESPTDKPMPMGNKKSPAAACRWHGTETGGTCMPRYIYRKRVPGVTRKAYADDALSQWYKKFQKEEERLLNAQGMFGRSKSKGKRLTGMTAQQADFQKYITEADD